MAQGVREDRCRPCCGQDCVILEGLPVAVHGLKQARLRLRAGLVVGGG
jgi:hypothetical protein